MASIPAKVANRIAAGLKRFQPILDAARARDANESDTIIIVMDLLHEMFGHDKYSEITSEHAIRGTYCDLAIKIDGALALLIEVKAIGLDLKDQHIKQAVDYAANQGCEWVALTNGAEWRAYKVSFTKPIDQELVVQFNLSDLSPRKDDDLELVWLLCKEGWQKARIGAYFQQRQALNRFTIGALLMSDTMVDILRRELRRISPETRIDEEQIRVVLATEVLRREVLEGDKADAAKKLVARAAHRVLRKSEEEPELKAGVSSDAPQPLPADPPKQ
jgi:predicted type IV restriction endonuclease